MNLSERFSHFFERHKKTLQTLLYGVLAALFLFLFFRYLMPLLYPFVIAYIVAFLLQPLINFLSNKAKIPRKLSILVLVLTAIFLLGLLLYKTGARLYYELNVLASNIKSFVSEMNENTELADEFIDNIASKIPFFDVRELLRTTWINIDEVIRNALNTIASKLADIDTIIPAITKVASFVPKMFIDTIIIIISAFYFSNDFKKINTFFATQLPDNARGFGRIIKAEFASTTGKYIRAYSLIIFITFAELFVGFTILDIRYAFVLAIITAIIDILPVLGTGTVLIPWAVYSLILGNIFLGVGLLILYLTITVIRQIMEPKIVGTYIGLYPLVTLICMYAGLKLMGIFGLFLLPITVIILKNLNDSGIIKLWKNPPEDEDNKNNSTKRNRKKRKKLIDIDKENHKSSK